MIHYKETLPGFEFGSLTINRIAHNEKKGWVLIEVTTPKGWIVINATKTGKITVHTDPGDVTVKAL